MTVVPSELSVSGASLSRYFETVNQTARELHSRSRKLEFDTTLHLLDKHITPQATVLEVGAGNGTYSLHFARHGHRVLATDSQSSSIEFIASQIEAQGLSKIQVRKIDPTRLEALSDWDFQAVLCLSPYASLRTRELRRRCLLECRRVVHDRGIVAVSYLSRAFAVAVLLRSGARLSSDLYRALLQGGDLQGKVYDSDLEALFLTTPEAFEAEVRSCGFEIVDHVGTDGPYGLFESQFESMDDEAYQDFLAYHLKTCGSPSNRGLSSHGLVILRKA